MIAVFGCVGEFEITDFYPKNKFKLIRNTDDVKGCLFDAIIVLPSRMYSEQQHDAYQYICYKQPSLFKWNKEVEPSIITEEQIATITPTPEMNGVIIDCKERTEDTNFRLYLSYNEVLVLSEQLKEFIKTMEVER